jgi:hypothetical protein
LLVDTVKAAATAARVDKPAAESEQQRLQQHLNAVAWLLQVQPTAAKTARTAQLLLHVPGVPLQFAEQLVAAGVRVSFEQICTAASSMVAGVELWVQAHLNLGVTADIPLDGFIMCAPDLVSLHIHQVLHSILFCCACWVDAQVLLYSSRPDAASAVQCWVANATVNSAALPMLLSTRLGISLH